MMTGRIEPVSAYFQIVGEDIVIRYQQIVPKERLLGLL